MLSITLIVTTVVVSVVVYYVIIYLNYMWRFRHFSGPFPLPIIGNLYDLSMLQFLKYLSTQRQRYGQVFRIFNLSRPFLVAADPVVARRVLSDSRAFYKGSDYSTIFSYVFGEGLVTSNGAKHTQDRKIFGRYFIRSNVLKYVDTINRLTKTAIEELLPTVDELPKVNNMEHFFAVLALRNFMQFSVNCDLSHDRKREDEFCKFVSQGSLAVGIMILLQAPMYEWNPGLKYPRTLNNACETLFNEIKNDRLAALARGEMEDVDDCLSAMINEQLPQKEMIDHFKTLVCAGHDTTAFFLSYMVYLLAVNGDKQELLWQEIKNVMGDRTEINADDIPGMNYLRCVMMETLRVYAIIPCVTRVAAEDVYIKEANITIPQGADVMVPMVAMNRDPELWDEPMVFRPERFMEKGNDFTSARDGYFPFAYGTRTCIGNTFAQVESALVMCQLMKKFKFEEDNSFRPIIVSGISLTTKNGIRVSLVPRS